MFAKCGSLADARMVFDGMDRHSVVSLTALMLGYAENGEEAGALEIFARMLQRDGEQGEELCAPNGWTFVAAAKACANLASKQEGEIIDGKVVKLGALEKTMVIHFQAVARSCDSDVLVANSLIDAYGKCGSLLDARMVFDMMPRRSVISWTALLTGYVDNGEEKLALELVWTMDQSPNARTLVAAVKACASLGDKDSLGREAVLEKGRRLHRKAVELGSEDDLYFANTLVDMYAKCGSVAEARRVFDRMASHSVVSWNALILGYTRNSSPEVALELFEKMATLELALTPGTFLAALKACLCLAMKEAGTEVHGKSVKLESLSKGMAIHSQALKHGCDLDVCVGSSLVDMYGECGSMDDACRAFERMPAHTVVSWDGLIIGYVQNEEPGAALEVFARMLQQGVEPDARSFVAALKACTGLTAKDDDGKQALGKTRCLRRGITLHSEAVQSGFASDRFVASTLIDLYAKCGSLSRAREVFETTKCSDVVSWNAVMLGYADNGKGEVALELFCRMELQGVASDVLSFVAALKACGSLAALGRTKLLHGKINRLGILPAEKNETVLLTNSLLDAYTKCGSMVDAGFVFSSVSSRNLVTWNTLMTGYSRQSNPSEVLELFHGLLDEGLCPNDVTFVCLLIACSRGGLVDTAQRFFRSMLSKFGTLPGMKHYHCIVDSLGRANRLNEVVKLVSEMPFSPDAVTWSTVLSASRTFRNVEVGMLAFDSWLDADPGGDEQGAAYVLAASLYESTRKRG